MTPLTKALATVRQKFEGSGLYPDERIAAALDMLRDELIVEMKAEVRAQWLYEAGDPFDDQGT